MTTAALDHQGFTEYPMRDVHRLIEPGPVVLVSTSDGHRANLMTNGFNMPIAHGALIGLVLGPWDHSYDALRDTGECVIAIPSIDLAERVVDVGNTSGREVDKWQRFGLTPAPAAVVRAPLVAECFANVECTVADDRLVGDYNLWILRGERAWFDATKRGAGEFHHRGDGTFSANASTVDLRDRMTKWPHLTR
ncbi:NADH-FMN oxidoreductase RutF, flavin reductase (DIM6/NTAB) family [Lentzea xinjiangensis]|uniref:NADH-FMN oxidoreductase RutF, flavin reductase (DIM6/NTAB) family n=1 Tax=Lentzea xinjiangensis TaxID=402600 RepID=A0A1H9K611_9PSEU|nr:flavin reductase family protein [Lentzea xinjiangensis]SEQ94656.1 NADH-FMN oxidoreductase RutF, flavin reductase (DIM6/NTAB) family [Lentzea xinjiangensis]